MPRSRCCRHGVISAIEVWHTQKFLGSVGNPFYMGTCNGLDSRPKRAEAMSSCGVIEQTKVWTVAALESEKDGRFLDCSRRLWLWYLYVRLLDTFQARFAWQGGECFVPYHTRVPRPPARAVVGDHARPSEV